MNKLSEKHGLYLLFTAFILLQFFRLLFSESAFSFGGFDSLNNYQAAKYIFIHPEEFFNSPSLYNILLAPFAQLGYNFVRALNILIAVATLIVIHKITSDLFPRSSFFPVLFAAFSPVFFVITVSCVPVLFFGFIFASAIYFFKHQKFLLAALIASLLPLIVAEGFIILIIFIIGFIFCRAYKYLPFLFTGIIVYGIIGLIALSDFLWYLPHFSFDFSIAKGQLNIGFPLIVLSLAGLFIWIIELSRKNYSASKVLAGSLIVYSFSIFLKTENSANLAAQYSLAGIVPVAAIFASKTIEFILEKIKSKNPAYLLFSLLALFQIVFLFSKNEILRKADYREQLIKKSGNYIRNNENGTKIIYFDPLLIHFLNIDPFDNAKSNRQIEDKQMPSENMDWGDILVWDSKFAPHEAEVHLEAVLADPFLKKLETFTPIDKNGSVAESDYSVQVFKKSANKNDTVAVTNHYETTLKFDEYLQQQVKNIDARKVWELDSTQEYSPTLTISPAVVKQLNKFEIKIQLKYFASEQLMPSEALLVFSVKDVGKNVWYEKADLVSSGNKWEQLNIHTEIPANLPESSEMLIYVWNKERRHLFIESIGVEINSY